MPCWLAIPWLILTSGPGADPSLPPYPASTQYLIRFNVADFRTAPAIRQNIEPWLSLVSEFRNGLRAIGVNPDDVEQIWLGGDDNYPASAVVVVRGSFQSAQLESHWQQLVRNRKFNAKTVRDADSVGFLLQLPPTALAIPGLPSTIIIAKAGPNAFALGVDKDRVFDVADPSVENPKPRTNLRLTPETNGSLIWNLPKPLFAPDAMLAGVVQLAASVNATTELTLELRFECESSAISQKLAESGKLEVDRFRHVFPPVARQQGTDARIINVIVALADSAQWQVEDRRAILKMAVSSDQLRRLLAKP
jgi:hypothetical protein